MSQTVWNLTHGNGFTLTDPMGTSQQFRYGIHADFLLVILAPLYLIWADPRMLLLVQAIVIGFGALPVFWIAREKLKNEKLAVIFSAAYLLYPPLQRMVMGDFHAVALSTTLLLFAYWYMEKEKYAVFGFFAILAGLGKEQVWLVIGLMGFYICVVKKKYVLGTIVSLLSFIIFYILMWKVIPSAALAKEHFALVYLSDFGSGISDVVANMIKNPILIMRDIISPDRLLYYARLLVSVGFLPLFAPLTLFFALPDLFINTVSSNGLMREIDYQYTSTITPFIIIASVSGFQAICAHLKNIVHIPFTTTKNIVGGLFLALCICSSVLWGDLPIGMNSRFFSAQEMEPEHAAIEAMIKSLDSSLSVSATNNIGSHFADRQRLYNFPIYSTVADVVVVKMGDPHAWPSAREQGIALWELLNNDEYLLVAQSGRFFAFRKVSSLSL